jgi:hypothetical protein
VATMAEAQARSAPADNGSAEAHAAGVIE